MKGFLSTIYQVLVLAITIRVFDAISGEHSDGAVLASAIGFYALWQSNRPTAAVGSASIHKPLGPANSAAESHGIHAQGNSK